ncbi:hypothetical protein [Spirosoma rhododendri]|uniref:Uncharacterized protein n=1 Tax=Spirosoma rhododendri TaxID=2728024 RepID=A0A7L5DVK3_9BACT|nr:hypothetical protein [Spirosoma rhododendri]QJD79580.1 hypothetical protein HH216_15015 [Spirosoma rhododendri]
MVVSAVCNPASADNSSPLNMPFKPPLTFTRASAQVSSLFIVSNPVDQRDELQPKPVDDPLSPSQFKRPLQRYKRAVWERHYWLQPALNTAFFNTPFSLNQSNQMRTDYQSSVVDTHRDTRWIIDKWHIQFLFSERMLVSIKHRSKALNWYEDADVAIEYMAQLEICFNSIRAFHKSFGSLPIIGDRLFNEDTGLIIKDRCIDGGLRTVTFVLSE